MFKLWLDDQREPPDATWVWCGDSETVIWFLTGWPGRIDYISFDHDLGEDDTAMEVVAHIENVAEMDMIKPPAFDVHSQNPVGRDNIQRAMDRIHERWQMRNETPT